MVPGSMPCSTHSAVLRVCRTMWQIRIRLLLSSSAMKSDARHARSSPLSTRWNAKMVPESVGISQAGSYSTAIFRPGSSMVITTMRNAKGTSRSPRTDPLCPSAASRQLWMRFLFLRCRSTCTGTALFFRLGQPFLSGQERAKGQLDFQGFLGQYMTYIFGGQGGKAGFGASSQGRTGRPGLRPAAARPMYGILPDRLMVGHPVLVRLIEVRVLVGQQI